MTHQHLNLQLLSSSSPQASSSGPTAPPEVFPPTEPTEIPADQGRSTARPRAAATRHSARIASVGADAEDTSPTQGSTSRTTPLPGVPAKSTTKLAAKPSAKQAAHQENAKSMAISRDPEVYPEPDQTPPVNIPDAPSPQAHPAPAPVQQAVDIAALLAHIAQLEQEQTARATQPAEPSSRTIPPTLFVSPEEVEKARAAVVAARKDESKVTLPEIVPGFKANPLDTGEIPLPFISPSDSSPLVSTLHFTHTEGNVQRLGSLPPNNPRRADAFARSHALVLSPSLS
ncbi:hypothetical protein DEU56DRAFT_948938 [Suillus clintonianus]|uniref:uncharacterized protein n=1 Tax=Suillus clintonianus TaxID=1904413 RepID=UPI001B86E5DE|nr:uncharacterized protein DEU56DRAFT_948938 [Suillus clintonianus]KAG2135440.1 hypothetical protein DEU56DRAFT_948938 [Suillus clintonianus]